MTKKILTSIFMISLSGILPATAMAQTSVCPIENCVNTTKHSHNDTTYAGHYAGDGHDHLICNVSGCTKTNSHQHNGETRLPHNESDGHKNHTTTRSNHSQTTNHTSKSNNHH